jgi:fatty acid desaturase
MSVTPTQWPLPPGSAAADYPVPARLNRTLCLLAFAGGILLLWVGSRRPEWWWALAVGVPFSYWMLLVYSLMHQGMHDCLLPGAAANYRWGVFISLLFPAPFTMVWTTHQGHHMRNRTDHELFDLYYPGDSRLFKYFQFYSILIGLFWPLVPLGGVAAATAPGLFRCAVFQRARSANYLLGDIRPHLVAAIRREMLAILLLFAGLFWLLALRWESVLIMYGCWAVNWSTRQYVSHAFTRRDIVEGALNLRTGRLMSALLLHMEWDLNHHRYPSVPWRYLPRIATDEPRASYGGQYWRQWLGPRLCTESAPERQGPVPLSVWDA